MPKIIHSGGQTGADRAALDWAIRHGVAHGGWCPKGRRAEDGPLADRYQLKETESAGYRQRTKRNIMDCDATLVVSLGIFDVAFSNLGNSVPIHAFLFDFFVTVLKVMLELLGVCRMRVGVGKMQGWVKQLMIKVVKCILPCIFNLEDYGFVAQTDRLT